MNPPVDPLQDLRSPTPSQSGNPAPGSQSSSNEIATLKNRINQLEATTVGLAIDLHEAESANQTLEERFESLELDNQKLRIQLSDLQRENVELRRQNTNALASLDRAMQDKAQFFEHGRKIRGLQRTIKALNEECDELKDRLANSDYNKYQRHVEQLEARIFAFSRSRIVAVKARAELRTRCKELEEKYRKLEEGFDSISKSFVTSLIKKGVAKRDDIAAIYTMNFLPVPEWLGEIEQ